MFKKTKKCNNAWSFSGEGEKEEGPPEVSRIRRNYDCNLTTLTLSYPRHIDTNDIGSCPQKTLNLSFDDEDPSTHCLVHY